MCGGCGGGGSGLEGEEWSSEGDEVAVARRERSGVANEVWW